MTRSVEGLFRCIWRGLQGHPGIAPLTFMTVMGFAIVVDKSLVRAIVAAVSTLLVFGSLVVVSAYQMGREQLRDKSDEVVSK